MDNVDIEIIRLVDNKRLIKRTFNCIGNKKPIVDYCIENRIYLENTDIERWCINFFNKSRSVVERRFLKLL